MNKTQIIKEEDVYKNTKDKLDKVGCGMCLAKWTQATVHLQMGETHSCHHPSTHKIPLAAIKRNPSALHNTRFKKLKRKEMLDGKRPSECNYCWNVEDNSEQFSDRVFKSNESWSLPHFDKIVNSNWRSNTNPSYLEVSFSNACNFKCSYCGPSFSSSWAQEAQKYGAYPTDDKFNDISKLKAENKMPIHHKEYNPYVDAFWKWWPELYRDLHTFRITGGEPLLSKDTWKVLDYIIEQDNPNRELNLAINSNLGIPDNLIDKLIEKIKIIEDRGLVKEFILFTSVDTWGKQAEYIRNGLEMSHFEDNLHTILGNGLQVGLMITYNVLSIPNIEELIYKVAELKIQYPDQVHWDSPHMTSPEHLSAQISNDKLINIMEKSLQTMKGYKQFTEGEYQKYRRTVEWIKNNRFEGEKLQRHRNDFVLFVREHDKRRNTSFIDSFGELGNEIINDFN